MSFDYAGSIWNRRCDDNIFELELGVVAGEEVADELRRVVDMCDDLRSVADEHEGDESQRLVELAADMRSKFQPAIQTIIDQLQETAMEAKELIGMLDKYSW